MHVMKRGRRKSKRGGIVGKNEGRDLASRYDVLVNLGDDWVEGENHGDPIIDQVVNEKVGSDKEMKTYLNESGKKVAVERDFRGSEKVKQIVKEGEKSTSPGDKRPNLLKENFKSNSQFRPSTMIEEA